MLAYLRGNYCIDESLLFATGKSNGGGFIDLLACSPHQDAPFAAFAMASPALYSDVAGSPCHPAHNTTPILEFHGSDDMVIPYSGGTRHNSSLPNIPAWLGRWAVRDGCAAGTSPSVASEYGGLVNVSAYSCVGVEDVVIGYLDEGQGHWWPSNVSNADNKGDVAPFDGSVVMVEFFRNQTSTSVRNSKSMQSLAMKTALTNLRTRLHYLLLLLLCI